MKKKTTSWSEPVGVCKAYIILNNLATLMLASWSCQCLCVSTERRGFWALPCGSDGEWELRKKWKRKRRKIKSKSTTHRQSCWLYLFFSVFLSFGFTFNGGRERVISPRRHFISFFFRPFLLHSARSGARRLGSTLRARCRFFPSRDSVGFMMQIEESKKREPNRATPAWLRYFV